MKPSSPTQKLRKLNSLQALRGVAAVLVLIFHIAAMQRTIAVPASQAELEILSGFWDRGYVGVDLFFVISGFIMVYVTQETGRNFKDVGGFLLSRATRIYSLWWVFAGLMTVYFWVVYHIPAPPDRISGVDQIVPYLLKSYLLFPQYNLPILGIGWTLIHEMYFYIVFAGTLFLPRRYLPVALLFWVVCIGAAYAAGSAQPVANSLSSLTASLLNLEFIGGAFAAWLINREKIKWARLCAIGGATVLLIGCVFYTSTGLSFMYWGRVAVFGLPCVALVYGLASLELRGTFNMPSWIVQIGDWSYSLYLSHFFAIAAVKVIFVKMSLFAAAPIALVFTVGAPGALDNLLFAFMAGIASIAFAGFSFRYIERPLLQFFRRLIKRRV